MIDLISLRLLDRWGSNSNKFCTSSLLLGRESVCPECHETGCSCSDCSLVKEKRKAPSLWKTTLSSHFSTYDFTLLIWMRNLSASGSTRGPLMSVHILERCPSFRFNAGRQTCKMPCAGWCSEEPLRTIPKNASWKCSNSLSTHISFLLIVLIDGSNNCSNIWNPL